jgi:hypothetical protein
MNSESWWLHECRHQGVNWSRTYLMRTGSVFGLEVIT